MTVIGVPRSWAISSSIGSSDGSGTTITRVFPCAFERHKGIPEHQVRGNRPEEFLIDREPVHVDELEPVALREALCRFVLDAALFAGYGNLRIGHSNSRPEVGTTSYHGTTIVVPTSVSCGSPEGLRYRSSGSAGLQPCPSGSAGLQSCPSGQPRLTHYARQLEQRHIQRQNQDGNDDTHDNQQCRLDDRDEPSD